MVSHGRAWLCGDVRAHTLTARGNLFKMNEVQSTDEWQLLGEFCYRIDHDMLRWKETALLLPDQVAGVLDLISQVNKQRGYCLMMSPTGEQPQRPEVRRAFASFLREHSEIRISVAIYGSGSVVMRAATMLAIGALRAAGAMRRIHLGFFDSATTAESWLLKEREFWLSTPA